MSGRYMETSIRWDSTLPEVMNHPRTRSSFTTSDAASPLLWLKMWGACLGPGMLEVSPQPNDQDWDSFLKLSSPDLGSEMDAKICLAQEEGKVVAYTSSAPAQMDDSLIVYVFLEREEPRGLSERSVPSCRLAYTTSRRVRCEGAESTQTVRHEAEYPLFSCCKSCGRSGLHNYRHDPLVEIASLEATFRSTKTNARGSSIGVMVARDWFEEPVEYTRTFLSSLPVRFTLLLPPIHKIKNNPRSLH
ncbi:hypothetical protein VNO77_04159 [Canavalia gladiata]|uniref:Uncharacterized protein n=1 Tax=Canavalia gladiata TaxID=3824 RepID=A0AAN9R8T1_CANGL